jgi:hypothetical protein
MNLGVADSFFAVLDRKNGLVHFHIALDYEPITNYVAIYDYRRDRWLTDPCVWGTAGGFLEDGAGLIHRCRIDDFGLLWREDAGNSDGVYAGSTTATLTGTPTVLAWPASAAAFNTTTATGAPGAPLERYSAAGAVLDQNRVYAASSTVLTLYYYSSATVTDAADTVAIGVIPGVFRIPQLTLDTARDKTVQQVVLGHGSGVSGAIKVETARNDGAYAAAAVEPSLSSAVQSVVPVRDNACRTWSLQVSQRYANLGFSIRYIEIFTALGAEHAR